MLGKILSRACSIPVNICRRIEFKIAHRSPRGYIRWLRKRGMKIGEGTMFFGRIFIDPTRPSLVEIGNNVGITLDVIILTHGYESMVLRNLYGELICSSGAVVIEDNVFIGMRTIILKGVHIGKNTVIGAGSVVAGDIPPNSVAAGCPARVICSIEDYYKKRSSACVEEAKAYARSIKANLDRSPVRADFAEEFPLFMGPEETHPDIPVRRKLGHMYEDYRRKHKPLYGSFEEFLEDAGVLETGTTCGTEVASRRSPDDD